MKFLFVTAHYGFLRNFESALRELARRGHEVRLCCDRIESMGGQEIVDRLTADFERFSVVQSPRHKKGLWHAYARSVRLCIDYLRYLTPAFAAAPQLRERAAGQVPRFIVRTGDAWPFRGDAGRRLLAGMLRALERAVPVSPEIRRFIEQERPDAILVTPLLYFGSDQVDYVRAARNVGVPSMLCVGSWDHLTTKGMIHEVPDRVTVWNSMQGEEAGEFHAVPAERIVVTGAQTYDHWFEQQPRTDARAFKRAVGLDAEQPYLLYLCSSIFIAPTERVDFVERWLRSVRSAPELRGVGILIRPHPQNAAQWEDFDPARFGNAAIWPREGANPVSLDSKADYFDTMFHSAAVIGLNTSGMIESGVIGRPVHTVLQHAFAGTQGGTLHFQHLIGVNGGLLYAADTLEAHVGELVRCLAASGSPDARSRNFVSGFVRPGGLDVRSTTVFGNAVEATARLDVTPQRTRPSWGPLLTPFTAPVAAVVQVVFLMRRGEGEGFVRRLSRALVEVPRQLSKQVRSSVRMGAHRTRKRLRAGWSLVSRPARLAGRALRRDAHRARKSVARGIGRVSRLLGMALRRGLKMFRRVAKLMRVAAWHVMPSSRPRE